MLNKHSISVIIPTYNRAKDLVVAVKSVLNQTLPVAEILICDDGSTDNSKEAIKELHNPLVKWVDCGRNGRPAIPRNIGIKQASSTWIAFLDSDDEWLPDKMEKQMHTVEATKYNAICCNAWRISNNTNKSLFFENMPLQDFSFNTMVEYNHVICSSMLCKKDLLLKCLLFPEEKELKALEDYVLWLKISAQNNIAYLHTPLLNYTDNPAESVRQDSDSSVNQRIIIFNYLKQQKRYLSKSQLVYLYKIFKRPYKSKICRIFDLERLAL